MSKFDEFIFRAIVRSELFNASPLFKSCLWIIGIDIQLQFDG